MKKIFYALLFTFFCTTSLNAQTVVVSGQCMTGTITLNPIGNIDGKPAFEGTGTVQGFPNVQINRSKHSPFFLIRYYLWW
ncbi:MAG: hypothetical protein ABI691_10655 [Ginsengibacter sp.]